ncbi:DnaJ domain-containing protein [Pilaira anomala]|nr:DnaJ domain-containing protein [Pilaira anomala]
MTNLPDYYAILEIPVTSTHDEIREAYKKQALLNHPDRLPANATLEEREEATKNFQLVADAYYILSDRSRRESYDKSRSKQDRFTPFSSAMPNSSTSQANHIFGDIFTDLLKPEVDRPSHIWRILGAGAGAVLGFIIGNVPGAAVVSHNFISQIFPLFLMALTSPFFFLIIGCTDRKNNRSNKRSQRSLCLYSISKIK